jgi:hypothetical protein
MIHTATPVTMVSYELLVFCSDRCAHACRQPSTSPLTKLLLFCPTPSSSAPYPILPSPGPLGEEERRSACKYGIFTFKLDDSLQSTLPDKFADDSDSWERFFGVPGYTKVSHVLSVTHRSSSWSKPAPEDEYVVNVFCSESAALFLSNPTFTCY